MDAIRRFALILLLIFAGMTLAAALHTHSSADGSSHCNLCQLSQTSADQIQFQPALPEPHDFGRACDDPCRIVVPALPVPHQDRAPPDA